VDLDLSNVPASPRGYLADKPVGVRTLALVALGAATVSMAGIEARQWPKAPVASRATPRNRLRP